MKTHLLSHQVALLDSLTTQLWRPHTARLLFKVLVLWLIARNLVLLPAHGDFWGSQSYVTVSFDSSYWTDWVVNLLSMPSVRDFYPLFLVGYFSCYTLALFDVAPRIFAALGLFFMLNLAKGSLVIGDGGDNLSQILAALLPLLAVRQGTSSSPSGSHQKTASIGIGMGLVFAVANVALLLMQLQICAVYLTAGFCKLIGTAWQNGTALYHIMQNPNFSLEAVATHMNIFWPVFVVANYATMAFQVAFPWLIWQRKFLVVLIPIGVFLHLGIAIGMALPMFGLVMCVSYLAFLPDEWSAKILNFFAEARISTVSHVSKFVSRSLPVSVRVKTFGPR